MTWKVEIGRYILYVHPYALKRNFFSVNMYYFIVRYNTKATTKWPGLLASSTN